MSDHRKQSRDDSQQARGDSTPPSLPRLGGPKRTTGRHTPSNPTGFTRACCEPFLSSDVSQEPYHSPDRHQRHLAPPRPEPGTSRRVCLLAGVYCTMVVFACTCCREGRARHADGYPKEVEATNGKHPGLHEQVPEGPACTLLGRQILTRATAARVVDETSATSTIHQPSDGQHHLPTPIER